LDSSYFIDVQNSFKFRQCVDGERLVDNQCQECPSGQYSFHYNPLQPTKECTACPPNTDDCYGTTILASPGYWRISKYSLVMLKCPYGKSACRGGGIGIPLPAVTGLIRPISFYAPTTVTTAGSDITADTSEGCAPGYEGPLCAICSDKYYFSSGSSTCVACQGKGQGQLATLILIPLVILILMVYTMFAAFLAKPVEDQPTMDNIIADPIDNDEVWGRNSITIKGMMEWLSIRATLVAPKLKIMLTVYQIISSFSFALEIQFTPHSTDLFHAFRLEAAGPVASTHRSYTTSS
jgi:hypothetical protein